MKNEAKEKETERRGTSELTRLLCFFDEIRDELGFNGHIRVESNIKGSIKLYLYLRSSIFEWTFQPQQLNWDFDKAKEVLCKKVDI